MRARTRHRRELRSFRRRGNEAAQAARIERHYSNETGCYGSAQGDLILIRNRTLTPSS